MTTEGFDPWEISLQRLAEIARNRAQPTLHKMTIGGADEANRVDAELLLQILNARATLEAAKRSSATAKSLVRATWALVGATVLLVIVGLIVGP